MRSRLLPRIRSRSLPADLTARRAGYFIAGATLVIAIAGALLIWASDDQEFPTLTSGLWWSVQTITTVGYGDHVPTTGTGRLIATAVMVTGVGFMAVVTASVSAVFVESARRRRTGDNDITLQHIAERLDQIERRLEELREDQ